MSEDCEHIFVSNSGQGGDPIFTLNRMMGPYPLMHVKCSGCNCRTWFTKEQWNAMTEDKEPENAD